MNAWQGKMVPFWGLKSTRMRLTKLNQQKIKVTVRMLRPGKFDKCLMRHARSWPGTLQEQSLQTHHVYSTLKQHGNALFHIVSTWNTRGVFVGMPRVANTSNIIVVKGTHQTHKQ